MEFLSLVKQGVVTALLLPGNAHSFLLRLARLLVILSTFSADKWFSLTLPIPFYLHICNIFARRLQRRRPLIELIERSVRPVRTQAERVGEMKGGSISPLAIHCSSP